ncbi:MAG TPA: hypothetical protein PKV29_00925, partial [Trichococcus flocculiformis]|nr:hypothetical protein [Trichococcus flocculiformis]
KPVWRGKTVQIAVRKPAETTLAGKNVRGQREVPRQTYFGGESRREFEPYKPENNTTQPQPGLSH